MVRAELLIVTVERERHAAIRAFPNFWLIQTGLSLSICAEAQPLPTRRNRTAVMSRPHQELERPRLRKTVLPGRGGLL